MSTLVESPAASASRNEDGERRVRTAPESKRRWWIAWPLGALKFVAGLICCQGPLLSLFVVGWTQRRMQRSALRKWGEDDPTRMAWHRSLANCFTRGAAAAVNAFAATLPATALWYYAWVLGWNLSFHKQYEQSHLGASLGLTGIALFALIMLYVPTALARQAATGDWRAFWRLGPNCRLVGYAAPRQLLWAIVFAAAAAVVMALRMVPYFAANGEALMAMTDAELRKWANDYYFMTALFLLPAYVLLWRSAARTYAAAVLSSARAGDQRVAFTPMERAAAERLHVIEDERRHGALAIATRWLGRLGTTGALAATFVVWVTVAMQVFVAQFFHYIPAQGWLNHPLVLLPWLRYLPPGLGG